jgi:hypothetical protein
MGKVILTLQGHTDKVWSVAISLDGKRIITGSADGTMKVWDAQTGKEILSLKGHTGPVNSVAISADGKRIVSGSKDKMAKVWDAQTGKELLSLDGHHWHLVSSVAISADGNRIVSGSYDHTVKLWDARSGKALLTLEGHTSEVSSVAISADGSHIVSTSGDQTLVWDAQTGKAVLSLMGHTGLVKSVAISPDGTRIISGGDKVLKVWDARTGRDLLTLKGHTSPVYSVAVSEDGLHIVSGSGDQTVKVWDATSGTELFLKVERDRVNSVAISADGKRVFGYSLRGKILAWDASSGRLLPDPPAHMPGNRIQVHRREATSADGKLAVSIEGNGNRIRVHRPDLDEARKQREARDRERLERLARFDPDWHRSQLDEALLAGDDFAAAFHLERLVRHGELPWDRGPSGTTLENEKDAKVAACIVSWALAARWDKPAATAFLEHARRNLEHQRNAGTLHHHGVALYRAGQNAEAERSLAESVKAHGKGGYADTWLFQAMLARQRGRQDEATRQMARFEEWHAKQKFTSWHQKAYQDVLLAEARKLLLAPPPMTKVAE